MTRLTYSLWIGYAADEHVARAVGARSVLNVAQDMNQVVGWPDLDYMHVGLIDGPGNPIVAYHAAILALAALLERSAPVVVCCHSGSRSLAVAIMHLEAIEQRGWDGWYSSLCNYTNRTLFRPHESHREAFDAINWKHLGRMM